MNKAHPIQLLTIDDVAELHQVSSKTVRRWIRAGERRLPSSVASGVSIQMTSNASLWSVSIDEQRCPHISFIFRRLQRYRDAVQA